MSPHPGGMRRRKDASSARRGATIVMVSAAILILLAMAMFSVDVAYIQLTRTELRAATDAAAKAGVDMLGQKQDVDEGIEAAIKVAAMNRVAGRPLVLTADDIEVGSATRQADGSWDFTPGAEPFSALRVSSLMDDSNVNGSIRLFFAGMFGSSTYSPQRVSTAAHLDQEVCLVLDRSHSMCFDMSGEDWVYPPGNPKAPESVKHPPHPKLSRWAALNDAVQGYLDLAVKSAPKPRVAMVTWSSDIGTNTLEFKLTGKTEKAVALETGLTIDFDPIRKGLKKRSENVMLGATNMSAGIDAGLAVLNSADVRPLAVRTLVLMTDGKWNQGRDPVDAARDAKAAGIVIHVVTLLDNADQPDMSAVAAITGGRRYHASDAAELRAAFEEIARTAPVILTE